MIENIQNKCHRLRKSKLILFLFPVYEITLPRESAAFQHTGDIYIDRAEKTAIKQGVSTALQLIGCHIQSGHINREEFLKDFRKYLDLFEKKILDDGDLSSNLDLEKIFLAKLHRHYPDVYTEVTEKYPVLNIVFGSRLENQPPINET